MRIHVASEFSKFPGPRFRTEGPKSAQEFREDWLSPKFLDAEHTGKRLVVDLDGGYGYSTSFLEESFGGLVRTFGLQRVEAVLEISSNDEPYLIEEIEEYMGAADHNAHQ